LHVNNLDGPEPAHTFHHLQAEAAQQATDADILESKTIRPSVPGGSDLARMKEILLALKREGDKAPGAAGF
jgi:hypothetical protein